MDGREFQQSLGSLRLWQGPNKDLRAPHKPLLLLWSLGRVRSGAGRLASYGEVVEPALVELLRRFGPPRRSSSPQDPYWRLCNDGLWEIPERASVPLVRNNKPSVGKALRQTSGGLPEALYEQLRHHPELVAAAAQKLLDAHFPKSLHEDIRNHVGLAAPDAVRDSAPRAPNFRPDVLKAYERRCAVCGFDIRIENSLLGLEAAHIKWHAAGGPDQVQNGLALCSFHHKALDLGAIGLAPSGGEVIVLVSDELSGTSQAFDQQLLSFSGRPLRRPHAKSLAPAPDYLAWHRAEVFRGSPREARL